MAVITVPPTRDALRVSSGRIFADAVELAGKNRASRSTNVNPVDSVSYDWLDAVRRGDEEALVRVFREYSPLVYGVALRITSSQADASDVLQEIFIGLPEALKHFDGRKFASWLRVVTSRRALMMLRSERRRRKYAFAVGRSGTGNLEDLTLSKIMIDRALARLQPTLRTVFVLREVEGLSHREIAEAIGITVNLSEVRLHRARRALQSLLT